MLTEIQIKKLVQGSRKHSCSGSSKKACVTIEAVAELPTEFGRFQVVAFSNTLDKKEHVAFIRGDLLGAESVPVRIHSECLTGDVIHSLRCDCHSQLVAALKQLGKKRKGVLLYLRQEGRGIGLVNKIKAYMLQDAGLDTFEANRALGFKDDERDFSIAAHMVKTLKIKSVQLMTNNPEKISALEEIGVKVTARIPLVMKPGVHNKKYLRTKQEKGHLLDE